MVRFDARLAAVILIWQVLTSCQDSGPATVYAEESATARGNPSASTVCVRRFGQVAQIRPEKVERFIRSYSEIPPAVVQKITEHHFHNYSIWLKELQPGQPCLFRYFEYTGDDFEADRDHMGEDPEVKKWKLAIENECLAKPLADKQEHWIDMQEVFYFDGATDVDVELNRVKRMAQVIGVRPELVDSYNYIHKHAWPEVLAAIKRGKIRNYPIHMTSIGDKVYIFGYLEYVGDNLDADMAAVGSDPATKAWIKFTDEVCQLPLSTRKEGEWWASMEPVYYQP